MARADQIRDRDSIQRETIYARIVGPVEVVIEPCWVGATQPTSPHFQLRLCEPSLSKNEGNAKFVFLFYERDDLEVFVDSINQALLTFQGGK